MPEKETETVPRADDGGDSLAENGAAPLVFISHDGRDAELAEAFGKLLKSVSAGMIKTFRSSEKKGGDGIDFGEEWYKRLMSILQSTSDVVCLFTERSLDRPWILFEAGVAKGKLNTPVIGVALGVPLSRVSAGPFYQFQNMDDSEADLAKLVHQLARRVPGLEVDPDVVKAQIAGFKATEAKLLKPVTPLPANKKTPSDDTEDSSIAKVMEEMKSLPSRVAERLMEGGESARRRRTRRIDPRMIERMIMSYEDPRDPIGLLMASSLVREDAPWLYELAIESYRVVKSGKRDAMIEQLRRVDRVMDVSHHTPFMEEMVSGREQHWLFMEFPRMLIHVIDRAVASLPPAASSPPNKKKRAPA